MELWDIYDVNKQRTGRTMKRNDWTMQPGDYHLTALAVILRSDGRFLITQRALTKAWAAGYWEIPGGGVRAGETSEEAARREVFEETGIDVSAAEAELVLTYRRDNPQEGDNYFVDVYRFKFDFDEADIKLQTDETLGYRLAYQNEIKKVAENGKFLHYKSIKKAFDD